MKIILLCGGSGHRLWPFSQATCPKPFLKLLPPLTPNGTPMSMLERIWSQLEIANLTSQTLIATSSSQVSLIKEQLSPSIPLIVEPSCRDTYPALLLASLYCYCHENTKADDIILVMPVDTYAEQDFFLELTRLEEMLKLSNADLALMGITPTHPSEKYGYILPKNPSQNHPSISYQKIDTFVEKPSTVDAQKLIEQGALWNSGILAFKMGFVLEHLQRFSLPLSYETLLTHYDTLPKISFDYQVVEKTLDKILIAYSGIWKDLGTWDTLTEILPDTIMGNASMSHDCENVHVLSTLPIPIKVLGLSNLIVAATPNGILIADKSQSTRVKNFGD